MTQDIDNGGPAFPQPCQENGYASNNQWNIAGGGLTKREWFAGMALQGMASHEDYHEDRFDAVAEHCYRQADAMIEEGKRR